MKPKDLLAEVAETAYVHQFVKDRKPKPGEVFANLPEHEKDLLRQLKSEDIANTRWPREVKIHIPGRFQI